MLCLVPITTWPDPSFTCVQEDKRTMSSLARSTFAKVTKLSTCGKRDSHRAFIGGAGGQE